MEPTAAVTLTHHGWVAQLDLCRPPHNHLDVEFLVRLADRLDALNTDDSCRAIVLSSSAKAFCAGADFGGVRSGGEPFDPGPFYVQAMRLFRSRKPIVAAVQGAAIGAGLGLALVADFRIAGRGARFSANFNRLGFHPGFGMSVTLPRLIGEQQAALLFYTGRRIDGECAARIGLADEVVADDQVLPTALGLAQEIATSAPLAVESTRQTLRTGLAEHIAQVNQRELAVQRPQFLSADFREGVAAMAERRAPDFHRR